MIEIGKKQKLTVAKIVDFGVYLAEDKNAKQEDRVLLPGKQVPEGTKEGDMLDVFIYKDSSDRLIATTREPKLQVSYTGVPFLYFLSEIMLPPVNIHSVGFADNSLHYFVNYVNILFNIIFYGFYIEILSTVTRF